MPASNIEIKTAKIKDASVSDGYEEDEGTNQDVVAKVSGVLSLDLDINGLIPSFGTTVEVESVTVPSKSGDSEVQIVSNESVSVGPVIPTFSPDAEIEFNLEQSIDDYSEYTLLLSLGEFFCTDNDFEAYIDYSINAMFTSVSRSKEVVEITYIQDSPVGGNYCEEVTDNT
jgi:hypothetical protein